MPTRSVLDIDVNTEKFDAYLAKYKEYEDALAASSGAWAGIASGTVGAANALDTLTSKAGKAGDAANARAMAQGRAADLQKRSDAEALTRMGRLGKASENLGHSTSRTATAWRSIAGDAKRVYGHIDDATKSLMKWSLMKGIFSGLVGAGGGLYGLDRLAGSAAAGRRQAMGSGVSFGDRRAFRTDYGRFVDDDAMLDNVTVAKMAPDSPQYTGLLGAGLNSKQIEGQNAADLSVSFLHRLPGLFPEGADDKFIKTKADALGLTTIMPVDNLKAYIRTSQKERDEADRSYPVDKKNMSIDGGSLKAWADLDTQLTRASTEIEKAFITGLAPIAPGLIDLSKGVVKLVGDFEGSKEVKGELDSLATGLAGFAKALNDPDSWWNKADKAVKTAEDATVEAGSSTHEWLKQNAPWATWDYWFPKKGGDAQSGSMGAGPNGDMARGQMGSDSTRGNAGQSGWWTSDRQSHAVDRLMKEGGLTEDGAKALVSRWKNVESPGGPESVNRSSGAAGIAQGLGSRRAAYLGSFDDQIGAAIGELNSSESRAKGLLNTPGMEATGASQFERAEGYDPRTGRDFFTDRTAAGMAGIAHALATQVAVQGTPAERGTMGASPFGVISDSAAFEAEQRRAAGTADDGDLDRLRRYHEQQATPSQDAFAKGNLLDKSKRYFAWADRASKLDNGTGGITTVDRRDWAKLSEGRTKDDVELGEATLNKLHAYGHPAFDARARGAVQARNHAVSDRLFSDDDLAAVKAVRGAPSLNDEQQKLDKAKSKSSGLNLDQYHRKPGHDIRISNASGANVSTIAGPASYG